MGLKLWLRHWASAWVRLLMGGDMDVRMETHPRVLHCRLGLHSIPECDSLPHARDCIVCPPTAYRSDRTVQVKDIEKEVDGGDSSHPSSYNGIIKGRRNEREVVSGTESMTRCALQAGSHRVSHVSPSVSPYVNDRATC